MIQKTTQQISYDVKTKSYLIGPFLLLKQHIDNVSTVMWLLFK